MRKTIVTALSVCLPGLALWTTGAHADNWKNTVNIVHRAAVTDGTLSGCGNDQTAFREDVRDRLINPAPHEPTRNVLGVLYEATRKRIEKDTKENGCNDESLKWHVDMRDRIQSTMEGKSMAELSGETQR